jgi:hypothetical protein
MVDGLVWHCLFIVVWMAALSNVHHYHHHSSAVCLKNSIFGFGPEMDVV